MLFSPFVINLLREKSGCPLRVSADCEQLALDIASVTKEHIGVNTIKRLLGFIADERSPRSSTLDVIARYLGFEHWDELRIHDDQTENSAFDDRDEYLTCYFNPGQKVRVTYLPNRTVKMECLGDCRFRVLSRENSKLMAGDELTVTHLIRNYPLMAVDVTRDGANLGSFMAGKAQGIDFELM